MQINIAERLRPYSHVPGDKFVLPGTYLGLEIFPTLLRLYDLDKAVPLLLQEQKFELTGPVKDFTVQQDLERGCIFVWGHYSEGYFRYRIEGSEQGKGFVMTIERSPQTQFNKKTQINYQTKTPSRLSLGSHSAQDWLLLRRNLNLAAILPIWHRLGQITPLTSNSGRGGTLDLLKKCQEEIETKQREQLYRSFANLFQAGFEGGLYPRLIDSQHQGFYVSSINAEFKGSALELLTEGSKAIQNLFVSQDEGRISILKALPIQFHCGRLLNVELGGRGKLSIEWSKKTIRRMIFVSSKEQEILFDFHSDLKKYRIRQGNKDRGKIVEVSCPLRVERDSIVFLDNFQK